MEGWKKILLLGLGGIFLWIIICILAKYSWLSFMRNLRNITYEEKKIRKERNNNPMTANPLYLNARSLFNLGMKEKKLNRQDIIGLIALLEKILGNHIKVYENFYFKNDAHKIYIYLKSKEINDADLLTIIKYLEVRV